MGQTVKLKPPLLQSAKVFGCPLGTPRGASLGIVSQERCLMAQQELNLPVTGMTCASCVLRVENCLLYTSPSPRD